MSEEYPDNIDKELYDSQIAASKEIARLQADNKQLREALEMEAETCNKWKGFTLDRDKRIAVLEGKVKAAKEGLENVFETANVYRLEGGGMSRAGHYIVLDHVDKALARLKE